MFQLDANVLMSYIKSKNFNMSLKVFPIGKESSSLNKWNKGNVSYMLPQLKKCNRNTKLNRGLFSVNDMIFQ